MSTSGTYAFDLANSGILLEAFDRIGVRPSAITREQMSSGVRSLNLELQTWGNRGVLLWAVELESLSLVQGQTTYDVPADTVSILDVYLEIDPNGPQQPIDRLILPISRTEYAMYPNKLQQAPPTVFWFDRLESPTITVWPTADGNGPYTLKYYRMRRIQDAGIASAQVPEVPYLFLEALCAGVAARLAQKYNQAIYMATKQEAMNQWTEAATENREMVDVYITPQLNSYWNF